MRTGLVHQAYFATGVAERYEILAKQLDTNWLAIRSRQLTGERPGDPISA
jgi:hypothetical protein